MPHLFRFVEMAPHSIFYHLTQIGESVWSRPMTLHGSNQQKVVLSWTVLSLSGLSYGEKTQYVQECDSGS